MIYNFHIFDGKGNCLFSLKPQGDEENKLLYGFLYTMKSFSNRITPVVIKEHNFFTCVTSAYQLVFLEMPTCVKFVIICNRDTSRTNDYYKEVLREIYRSVYVEYHVKNPVASPQATSVESELFRKKVNEYFSKIQ